MNANSVFYGQPITREDYLSARLIAEPLCLFDCDMYVDGSAAVIVTSAERARNLRQQPAYISGFGQTLGFAHAPIIPLEGAMESERYLAKNLWESSGYGPQDVDQANVYDGFSPFVYWWLESLGFCKEGEAYQFVQDGRIEIGGALPLNTAGGNLGVGRMHGMGHISDAVYQLQGRAGPRQVQDCTITCAVVGMPYLAGGLVFSKEP
jgi:acetyl-CoA acetyltransferase